MIGIHYGKNLLVFFAIVVGGRCPALIGNCEHWSVFVSVVFPHPPSLAFKAFSPSSLWFHVHDEQTRARRPLHPLYKIPRPFTAKLKILGGDNFLFDSSFSADGPFSLHPPRPADGAVMATHARASSCLPPCRCFASRLRSRSTIFALLAYYRCSGRRCCCRCCCRCSCRCCCNFVGLD